MASTEKSPEAFRTISEVARWLETPAHVLRYWESRFPEIKPVKGAGGRRYYRPEDMRLVGGIKHLLHSEGQTIGAVQDQLQRDGLDSVARHSPPLPKGEPEADAHRTPASVSADTQEAGPYEPAPSDAKRQARAPAGFFFDDQANSGSGLDDVEKAAASASGTEDQDGVPDRFGIVGSVPEDGASHAISAVEEPAGHESAKLAKTVATPPWEDQTEGPEAAEAAPADDTHPSADIETDRADPEPETATVLHTHGKTLPDLPDLPPDPEDSSTQAPALPTAMADLRAVDPTTIRAARPALRTLHDRLRRLVEQD